jgi:glycine/D-amino acid oxidase-like deaminating enzyme
MKLRDGARIAVIGAGPSGLVAAKEALEAGFDATVFEASDDLGGRGRRRARGDGRERPCRVRARITDDDPRHRRQRRRRSRVALQPRDRRDAAIGREYRDAIRFVKPPTAVQAALFGPLAAIARRTGRDPLAPELHGEAAPCVIPDPGEEGLAELLAKPVGVRAARGR